MLLSTAYLPPISWFASAAEGFTLSPDKVIPAVVYIEACENYQKQSYRNRCRIFSSNGIENLNVPIVHKDGSFRRPIKEIEVDYSVPWVQKTERAISSAYYSSPFFEYYKDSIFEVLESGYLTLWELNMSLINVISSKLGLDIDFRETLKFIPDGSSVNCKDLRNVIHPKKTNTVLSKLGLEKPYFQVFSRKYGFMPDLSIIDLLFCEGPDSILYLKPYIRR